MVTFVRLAAALVLLGYSLPTQATHVAEFEAVLDTAQEVPAPVGATPGAGGSGTFILEDGGGVEAMVNFQGLSGVPIFAHIHQGALGVAGPVRSDFTDSLVGLGQAGTIAGSGSIALSKELQQAMFAGELYFNVHTAANPDGELRGQIRLKPGVCSCEGAGSPGQFKSCVRQAMRGIQKDERLEDFKLLRRLFVKAACGKVKAPRKLVACCLPLTPAQNIVTDRICASVKAMACTNLGGTSVGTGVACASSPCSVGASPG